MVKNRPTRRQAWRIQKIQDERQLRAERKAARLERAGGHDTLGVEQQGLVLINYGPVLEVEAADGDVYRCVARRNVELPVAGDVVSWRAAQGKRDGVVTGVGHRRTVLTRPDAGGQPKALASNIDQLVIVIAPRPAYSVDLIDHYLVAAETIGIRPLLLFNKADLLKPDDGKRVEEELGLYERAGYPLLYASTKARDGLDALASALSGNTSIFVGQSGVGKSSLINALLPLETARVGALIDERHGSHTTSASRLYHLPGGGSIIDSPGVRAFGLTPLPPQAIAAGFIEFRRHLGHCRFRDCRHATEPGCALHAAVEAGEIDVRRLQSYHRIVRDFGIS